MCYIHEYVVLGMRKSFNLLSAKQSNLYNIQTGRLLQVSIIQQVTYYY